MATSPQLLRRPTVALPAFGEIPDIFGLACDMHSGGLNARHGRLSKAVGAGLKHGGRLILSRMPKSRTLTLLFCNLRERWA